MGVYMQPGANPQQPGFNPQQPGVNPQQPGVNPLQSGQLPLGMPPGYPMQGATQLSIRTLQERTKDPEKIPESKRQQTLNYTEDVGQNAQGG